MIRIKCDCCGREKNSSPKSRGTPWRTFEYLCHLDKDRRDKGGYGTFIDGKRVSISGRSECKDLCPVCYNKVMIAAVLKFEELKERHEDN